MELLCKRIISKLLRKKYEFLITKLYKFNGYRSMSTFYTIGNSTCRLKDFSLNTLSISVNNRTHNKYMCKSSFSSKCWKCGKNLSEVEIFCEKCDSLQQINKFSNYFEIIGVDRSYDLNLSELSQKYRKLQSVLHPDKFSNKSKEEKLISEENSAIVNKAYFTLLHPLDRGLYMLKLNGLHIEEGSVQMDKNFLMEIMEINEEIENETDPKVLNILHETNKTKLNLLTREVTDAFQKEDTSKAKEILTKMKYYASIDNKIKELKQKLEIPN